MNSDYSSNLSRSLYIVSGQRALVSDFIANTVKGIEKDALFVSDSNAAYENVESVGFKQAKSFLGQERKLLVFDLIDTLDPDALAAVSGLIVGGGALILCMPEKNTWPAHFSTPFAKRFIQFIENAKFANFIDVNDQSKEDILSNLEMIEPNSEFDLTIDQDNVLNAITTLIDSDIKQTLMVVSDRGRGKSTSLGVAAAMLIKSRKIKILITAPRFKACEVAFISARDNLTDAKIKQAGIKYEQSEFKFMAPDEILRTDSDADVLFIDEAASIPLPILNQLQQRFNKTVFVSTVHGYEGTGRGFSVRFPKDLEKEGESWEKIEMKTPVRWKSGDELEAWLFEWLCLDADIMDGGVDDAISLNIDAITIRKIEKDELLNNENLLRQVFSLLVLAHYKTRPSDLQRMLDDKVVITVAETLGKVIAVILSADEGQFEKDISTAVYQGKRRLQGNLLAQTLTYHCGVEEAACALSHRIMRVVVHPKFQDFGVGSKLLNYLIDYLKTRNVDLLGASFGLTEKLARFWQRNNFKIVRVGLKKEQSSGEHAAVYLQSFTESGASIESQASERFTQHFPLLQLSVLKDIDSSFIKSTEIMISKQLSNSEMLDIESFMRHDRAYELCIAGVKKWVGLHFMELSSDKNQAKFYIVLENVVINNMSWKDVVTEMNLKGKNQAQDLFKQAVVYLWSQNHKSVA